MRCFNDYHLKIYNNKSGKPKHIILWLDCTIVDLSMTKVDKITCGWSFQNSKYLHPFHSYMKLDQGHKKSYHFLRSSK